jgi:hypothetical protein
LFDHSVVGMTGEIRDFHVERVIPAESRKGARTMA